MESNHWYTRTGESAHTQPTKAGAKNAMRATTIKDAKKLDLLPSVSSILKVVHNSPLERWKLNQVAKACAENPIHPLEHESIDTYVNAMIAKAFEETSKAADLGTRIHAAIEAFLTNSDSNDSEANIYAINAINRIKGLGLSIVASEVGVVSDEYGYAGRTDIAFTADGGMTTGILDFKSTKTKEGEPVIEKQGYAAQIAAYHNAYWSKGMGIRDTSVGYNVFISTTEMGRIDVVKYDAERLRKEFDFFNAAAQIWRYKNNYDPRKQC
jgi:hypothetical protein